tara:strand:- start:221 stop:442 length:222 start_codon:yes stop_codon:yes gene_type:complete
MPGKQPRAGEIVTIKIVRDTSQPLGAQILDALEAAGYDREFARQFLQVRYISWDEEVAKQARGKTRRPGWLRP